MEDWEDELNESILNVLESPTVQAQAKACIEAFDMAQKYQKLSMEWEANMKGDKLIFPASKVHQEQQKLREDRMSAHATFYLVFCK